MNAIQFDLNLPKYTLAKALGRYFPSLFWHSQLSCVKLKKQEDLPLRHPDWVKIEVTYSGICGSDMNLIFLNDSPTTSPYASFPFTIGHEIVGKVIEMGENVKDIHIGDRVVVDPVLSCESRGFHELCPACQRGDYSLCENMTNGDISPGLLIGTCKDTGGGWSSHLNTHKSQVFKLPQEVDDQNGVMIEPFSCALHAVMRNKPKKDDTILIIGAGVIGLCTVAAIRALGYDNHVIILAKHGFQASLARHYGADNVIMLTKGNHYYEDVSEALQAQLLKPVFGPPVVQGGADIVIECVGRKSSVNDALRLTKSGGKVILLGLAGILKDIDWTTVWLNELEVKGSFAYSTEMYEGQPTRTLAVAIDLIKKGKVNLAPFITHRFPLHQYKEAFTVASTKRKGDAIKIVFEPNAK
ncbi:zinc-dependent alcohol dehydrogenase [Caldalkalibacillus salinus]|uniref:zinc-dependent alcohol dehydrogenase n=1 Tax=Caldalkalibacillus salinus TaxID=2803787 RepID=UPI001921AA4E|nr:alcohol dehydrogenase catalytic domain-containing protein [Caldalkalibacillus salinus]